MWNRYDRSVKRDRSGLKSIKNKAEKKSYLQFFLCFHPYMCRYCRKKRRNRYDNAHIGRHCISQGNIFQKIVKTDSAQSRRLFIADDILGKPGKFPLSCDLLCQSGHGLFGNMNPSVVKAPFVNLYAAMIISRMKQYDISLFYDVLLIFAGKDTPSALHKT